jgi:NitT/TauT family transport system substrate-binding protein
MWQRLAGGLFIVALVVGGGACAPAAGPATVPNAVRDAAPTAAPVAVATGQGEGAPPKPVHQFELPMASQNATMLPFWVAAEQGLFRRHGLDVTLVNLPPSTATQALQSGSVPVAATGGSTVTAYVGGATDLVYVAGVSNKAPYRVVVRPDILRMEDLRGKSVGLGAPGASPAVAMAELVRRNGLEPDRDVMFTYMRDSSATVAALLSGSIQAIVTGSPQADYALSEGNRLLLDMRDLNLPILGINVSSRREMVERDPDLVRRVLMAYVEGIQLARDRPEDAVPALMRGTQVDDRGLAELAYKEYSAIWDPWPSEAGIQTLLDSMDAPAARSVRPAEMIDERFLRELERSGWLAEHYRAP